MILVFVALAAAVLDLRLYHRVSHDTLFIGTQSHHKNASRLVKSYAFLHLDHHSQLAKSQRAMPPPVSKRIHFQRVVDAPGCVVPIADGAEWKTVPAFRLYTRNNQQMTPVFIQRAVQNGMQRWTCAIGDRMIIGPIERVVTNLGGNDIDIDTYDGVNEIGIGQITGRPGTIAMTILFGVFDGPVEERELVGFKMIFDESSYRFGNASERANVVDFESIATHECGHVFGLDDVYDAACADVTMFGTTASGERKKQTLENSDVDAIRSLYD